MTLGPLAHLFSVELAPSTLLKAGGGVARLLPALPSGTRVFLPSLPADPADAIEQSIALLRRSHAGLVPVPHIPAQRVQSLAVLERQLTAWQRAAGDGVITEAMVVRGDAHGHSTDQGAEAVAVPATSIAAPPFEHSLALLETGVLQRHGFDAVSLCGHPEGVGPLDAVAARAALRRKLEWADSAGVASRVVTQFCFDVGATTRFVDELRRHHACPVSLGVVGPSSVSMRGRMATRCGVAPPAAASSTSHDDGHDGWPDGYVRELTRWHELHGDGVSVHVYPFGGVRRTLEWVGVATELPT